jgi:hypothetical protein
MMLLLTFDLKTFLARDDEKRLCILCLCSKKMSASPISNFIRVHPELKDMNLEEEKPHFNRKVCKTCRQQLDNSYLQSSVGSYILQRQV